MVDSAPEELLEGDEWSPETLTAPVHISISTDDSEREVENNISPKTGPPPNRFQLTPTPKFPGSVISPGTGVSTTGVNAIPGNSESSFISSILGRRSRTRSSTAYKNSGD